MEDCENIAAYQRLQYVGSKTNNLMVIGGVGLVSNRVRNKVVLDQNASIDL